MKKNLRTILLWACAAAACVPALAQFRKADDAIKYRQSVMFIMGTHLDSRLRPMTSGRSPFDPKAALESAEVVAQLSRLPWPAFGPGTDQGMTDAKPAVWTEQAKFKDLADKMQAETAKLAVAARAGDLEGLKAAYLATAKSCKACHDVYTTQ